MKHNDGHRSIIPRGRPPHTLDGNFVNKIALKKRDIGPSGQPPIHCRVLEGILRPPLPPFGPVNDRPTDRRRVRHIPRRGWDADRGPWTTSRSPPSQPPRPSPPSPSSASARTPRRRPTPPPRVCAGRHRNRNQRRSAIFPPPSPRPFESYLIFNAQLQISKHTPTSVCNAPLHFPFPLRSQYSSEKAIAGVCPQPPPRRFW